MGFNDVLAKRPHQTSAKCISSSGTLFIMNVDEFRTVLARDKIIRESVEENAKILDDRHSQLNRHNAKFTHQKPLFE